MAAITKLLAAKANNTERKLSNVSTEHAVDFTIRDRIVNKKHEAPRQRHLRWNVAPGDYRWLGTLIADSVTYFGR